MPEPSSTDLIIGIPTQDQRAIVPSILELGALGQLLSYANRSICIDGSPRSRRLPPSQYGR